MEEMKTKVCAMLDGIYIIAVESENNIVNFCGNPYTVIDEGTGYKYEHAQGNYFENRVWENGVPNYAYDGDTVRETTADEREAWVEAHKATAEDSTEDIMLEMLADHEERICLMELGVEE